MVAALLVTYIGIFFAMGGIDLAELRQNLFGASLVLIAALTTAIYFLIGERYTHELGSTRFAAIGMSASAVMLALHFAVFRSFDELRALQAYDWMLLVILGVFCVFIPGLLQAEGMRRVGRAARAPSAAPSARRPRSSWRRCSSASGSTAGSLLGSAMIVGSVLVLSWPKRVSGGRALEAEAERFPVAGVYLLVDPARAGFERRKIIPSLTRRSMSAHGFGTAGNLRSRDMACQTSRPRIVGEQSKPRWQAASSQAMIIACRARLPRPRTPSRRIARSRHITAGSRERMAIATRRRPLLGVFASVVVVSLARPPRAFAAGRR